MKAQHLIVAAMAALLAATSTQASVEISAAPTNAMNCTGGVCSPTSKKAVLNTTDLANMLATSDVKVVTGSGAVAITVTAPFSWTSTHRLTLDANLNVSFKAPVEIAGQGAVTIVTNDGGTGGDLIFFDGGKLDFWDTGSALTINGTIYALANDIATLGNDFKSDNAAHVALAKDYNANGTRQYRGPPISVVGGIFEGLGHTIANLTVRGIRCRDDQSVGLISRISSSGIVRDLHLTKVKLKSKEARFVGAVTGLNAGTISNVTVMGSGNVESGFGPGECGPYGYLGGIAGENAGVITRSHADVKLTAVDNLHDKFRAYVGGLVGLSGGISGDFLGSIDLSSSAGSITPASSSYVGGLAGEAFSVSRSFSTVTINNPVTGDGQPGAAGGLLGFGGNVTDSYASGPNIGAGLIGRTAESFVVTSYATGSVLNGEPGFVGLIDFPDTFTNDYWDVDTTGSGNGCGSGDCTGVTGLTDQQLRSGLPAGFDSSIWAHNKNINNGYPYLIDNPPT